MPYCPKCKSASRHRMKLKGLYNIIPKAEAYACDKCNTYYIWFTLIKKSISIKKY